MAENQLFHNFSSGLVSYSWCPSLTVNLGSLIVDEKYATVKHWSQIPMTKQFLIFLPSLHQYEYDLVMARWIAWQHTRQLKTMNEHKNDRERKKNNYKQKIFGRMRKSYRRCTIFDWCRKQSRCHNLRSLSFARASRKSLHTTNCAIIFTFERVYNKKKKNIIWILSVGGQNLAVRAEVIL